MSLLALSGTNSVSGGYEIDNSLKFEADNTEYLSFANSVGENRRTWTYSTWVKKTELFGAGSVGGTLFGAYLDSNDRARIEQYGDQLGLHGKISGTTAVNVRTTMALRDTAAWYHCMVVLDTTQATETDRVKIYVNGVQETSMVATTYPPQNYQFAINNAVNHFVGQKGDNTDYFCGYMAETYFIDGQALTPTSFGEFDDDSGIWKPIEFTGTYPSADTNHFYLNFDDSSNLGKDSSGNGKNMTSNNITAADQATDTPTNNFATLNPIHIYSPAALPTISHGATKLTTTYQGWWTAAVSNIAFTRGKWYFEARSATSSTHLSAIGYGDEADIENWGIDRNANRQCHPGRTHSGVPSKSFAYIGSDTEGASYGRIFPNGTSPSTRVNYIYTDVIGVAIDADNGYAYWHKNGTYINSGDPTSGSSGTGGYAVPSGTGTNGTLLPSVGAYYHSSIGVIEVNFGGYTEMSISSAASDANGYGTFEHAPPSGYYAICTKNLAEYG